MYYDPAFIFVLTICEACQILPTIMASPLADQHAFVTGGGSGIGKAIAKALAESGARVTIAGRHLQRLEQAAKEIGADCIVMDVSDAESVEQGFQRSESVGILVNCAGNARTAPFDGTDHKLWDEMIRLNLSGTFFCMKACLPSMLSRNYGRIVNIASLGGLTGYAYASAYCAAKHGVIGLTRSVALETARSGITVNAVCPGYTYTEMVARAIQDIVAKTGRAEDDIRASMFSRNPQGRLVTPEDVANAVVWLCVPGSESMTGQSVAVGGGELM
jgi:3-hydroxybutyrate dehydrogenase